MSDDRVWASEDEKVTHDLRKFSCGLALLSLDGHLAEEMPDCRPDVVTHR